MCAFRSEIYHSYPILLSGNFPKIATTCTVCTLYIYTESEAINCQLFRFATMPTCGPLFLYFLLTVKISRFFNSEYMLFF